MNEIREALEGTALLLFWTQLGWAGIPLIPNKAGRIALAFVLVLFVAAIVAIAFALIWWDVLTA